MFKLRYMEFRSLRFASEKEEGDAAAIITEISDDGSVSFQEDALIFKDGSEISNPHYNMRIVTVTGTIVAKTREALVLAKEKFYRNCDGKTKDRLYYFNGISKYFIKAFSDIPVFSKPQGNSVDFTVNFNCYDFYWYAASLTSIAAYEMTNYIQSDGFSLPLMFSSFVSEANVLNTENFAIFPTVRIRNTGAAAKNAEVTVKNLTSGESIRFSGYNLKSGDVIEIDTLSLKAVSNAESVVNYFNDFSDFCLLPGTNSIKTTLGTDASKIAAEISYYRPFIGV